MISVGEVELYRHARDGSGDLVFDTLGWGECFGEIGLLTNEPPLFSIRAQSDVRLLTLTQEQLLHQLNNSLELNRVFWCLVVERLQALLITLNAERGHGIRGRLEILTLPNLVQTLHVCRRSGTLTLQESNPQARLHFRSGHLRAVEHPPIFGESAFFELAALTAGEFSFTDHEVAWDESAAVRADTMALLMESMRRQDERNFV